MNAAAQAIVDRLAKMKSLADSGVGGERENAARLMEMVAAKYGIDLRDIDTLDEQESIHRIDIPRGWKLNIIRQLLALMRVERYGSAKVYDHCIIVPRIIIRKGRVRSICDSVKCTKSQFVELMAKYTILSRDYDRQRKALFRAFIIANDLLCPYDPDSAPLTRLSIFDGKDGVFSWILLAGLHYIAVHDVQAGETFGEG